MKGNNSSSNRESRLDKRGKRRKTNLILNGLIGLVILLIIIVSGSIFFSGNDDEASTADKKQESKQTDEQKNNNESTSGQVSEGNETESESEQQTEEETEEETEELESAEEDEVITEGGSAPDVKNTIENPNWKPVGTSQTGEHTAVYDQNAVDWNEMVQAISYATGIDQGNMTIWFLGNNGPNSSVGTVSAKDGQQKYRVYIDWVDGEGWKPVKLEELK